MIVEIIVFALFACCCACCRRIQTTFDEIETERRENAKRILYICVSRDHLHFESTPIRQTLLFDARRCYWEPKPNDNDIDVPFVSNRDNIESVADSLANALYFRHLWHDYHDNLLIFDTYEELCFVGRPRLVFEFASRVVRKRIFNTRRRWSFVETENERHSRASSSRASDRTRP